MAKPDIKITPKRFADRATRILVRGSAQVATGCTRTKDRSGYVVGHFTTHGQAQQWKHDVEALGYRTDIPVSDKHIVLATAT
ncbi:MAG: hypothetical protein MUC88_00065 [Planctomycetes bacterium]|jgi:hypothetical protein|nr:hypothetical protein [Planctomycetota bacterium]